MFVKEARHDDGAYKPNISVVKTGEDDQKFKVIVGYVVSSRPAWVTGDSVSKPR